MPSYKFSYFDGRGRGELCRYIFSAAGQDFEDNRVSHDDWPTVKPSTPFGQMPVLEVDGKKLAQSHSIARYLAREFNLAGKSNWEQGVADQYLELAEDMFKEIIKWFYAKSEEEKKEVLKHLTDEVFPKYLGMFETALNANGGKYFVGNSLTVADLAVYNVFDTPLRRIPTLMDEYPNLKGLRARVEEIPEIGEYIKNRKMTDM